MANKQPIPPTPEMADDFSEAMNSIFSSLPHAEELSTLQVSKQFSSFAGCSGNVMPFRDNALTEEERKGFLAMLDELDSQQG